MRKEIDRLKELTINHIVSHSHLRLQGLFKKMNINRMLFSSEGFRLGPSEITN